MKGILSWTVCVILLLCIQTPTSESTATVKISFLDFVNPYERKFDGDCCDPLCGSACDLLYLICFNDSSPMPVCTTKVYYTYASPGLSLIYQLDSWTGQLPLKILVYDIDAGKNDFVDYFIINVNMSSVLYSPQSGNQSSISSTTIPNSFPTTFFTTIPGSTVTSAKSNSSFSYPGIRQVFNTQILLDVLVVCDPNYYTAQCDVYCAKADTCDGHYTCDNVTGQKVCSPQWTGSRCNVWSGSNACLTPSVPPTKGIGPCQMFDVVLILDSSGSINNLDPSNWQYMKSFAKSLSDRVTIGPSDFQFGVIVFSDFAQLTIKLNDAPTPSLFQNRIDALPYLGQKTNLRDGLRLARTQAFLARNGGRNDAHRSVILIYDGEKPTPEFGTLVNEASRLRDSGVDVTVVSLRYFFANGLATPDLVRSIASLPLVDHLSYDLDSWSRLSNTLAPTILANLYDSCEQKISSGASDTTVMPSNTMGLTGIPSSTIPVSLSASTTLPQPRTSLPIASSASFSSFFSSFTMIPTPAVNTDQYCSFRGSCTPQNGSNKCCCRPGYVGNQCEYEDDPCAENPCNGGTCNRMNRLDFTCICLPGFSGGRCQIIGSAISTCNSSMNTSQPPLQCSSIPQAPCTEFYYGPNCDKFCRSENTCSAHYSCDSSGEKVCMPGWKNVSANCTENDGYNSTSCLGQCLKGGFCLGTICCCQSGFTGVNCEISILNGTTSVVMSSTTGITGTTPLVFTGVSASLSGSVSASGSSTLSSSPTVFTGITNPSASPTLFTGITNSSASPTIFTGITNSTASPTIFTGITNSSASPTIFTGITNPSASPTIFTGITNSSASPTVFTGITNPPASTTIFTGITNSSASPTIFTGITNSSASTTIFTGLTNPSASPTIFTGITNSSASPTIFTGITNSSASPTIFTGITNSSVSPTTFFPGISNSSAVIASTSSLSGTTSFPISPTTPSADNSSLTSSANSSVSTSTTLSQQDQLIAFLRNYIRNNFPNLDPIEQQQLLNELLSVLTAPAAVAVDDSLSRVPLYISPPWQGNGRLSNYSIQLEILEAYIDKDVDNNWQLKLKYYYLLTDLRTGNVTKVSPDEYQQLMYQIDDMKMDVSHLDPANRFQIVVYGSHLDISVQSKFAVALRNAYGLLNSAWTKKSSARVLIGDAEDLIALTGEDLTLINFWLVSSVSDTELPNSIINPSSASVNTEFSNLGIMTNVCQSAVWFRANDSYGIFVKDVVYHKDLVKFTGLLTRYLKNNSRIPSDFTATVVKQERFFLSNGTLVVRLVYYVYNATSLAVIPKTLGFVPPSSEQLMALLSPSNMPYELVKTSESIHALRLDWAFFISVFNHPVNSTFSIIQDIVEERIRKIPNYAAANVRVAGSEEYIYFTKTKRFAFNRILWFLFNNGSLVDGRRYQSLFPPMAEWMSLLQAVTLPNGEKYQLVIGDMSADLVVPRSQCFYQPIVGSIFDFESIEDAMSSLLQRETMELITNQSIATVVFAEEYVNASGSSVTVLFYIIKTPNQDLYFSILDASTLPDDFVPTSGLASEIASNGLSSRSYILLDKSEFEKMTRYASLCRLFLKQPPLSADQNKFSQKLTDYFKSLSVTAIVRILTIEEFVERDGYSLWSIGYSLMLGGETVWPENLNSAEVKPNVDVISITGLPYTSVLPATDVVHRVGNLFSFYATGGFSVGDLKLLENLLTREFKQEFPEFLDSVIEANIVSLMEYVDGNGTSVWRIFYRLNVDQWSLSARQHNAISNNNLSTIFARFSAAHLWTGNLDLLAEVSSLSSVAMHLAVFPESDLVLFGKLLQTAVAQTLQSFANVNWQLVLSVKRQRECITLDGIVVWCVDFTASLAGESLYPRLLPMGHVNALAFSNVLLHSSSSLARNELIDISPSFVYDYKKSFHILLNQQLNSSHLVSLEAFLTQLYEYIAPNSEVEVKVAGIEKVVTISGLSLLDSPSAWQVLYYITLDGFPLNGAVDTPLNSTVVDAFIQRSNQTVWKKLFIFDTSLRVVRDTECLKLLFLGRISSTNFPMLNKDLGLRLQQILGTGDVSAMALQRLTMISQIGIIYTEIHFAIMQNGKILDANLIQADSLDKISTLNGIALISDPDTSIPGGLYEESSLFSIGFQQPVIGSSSYALLETVLTRAHEGSFCSQASVKTVTQFEAIETSGLSIYLVLYSLSCAGVKQDSRIFSQKLDSLSISGFSSQLYTRDIKPFIPVSQLLKIPFTSYVSPSDFSAIEDNLHMSAASMSPELAEIEFQVLDQRDYLDNDGNFYYTLLCSSTLKDRVLNGFDLFPILNRTISSIGHIIGPSGSQYVISTSDPKVLKPAKSAVVVYFENYIQRTDEPKLLLTIINAMPSLGDKFRNITAEINRIDRVLDSRSILHLRYIIFFTTPVLPNECIDLSLEPPVDQSILTFILPTTSPIVSLVAPVRQLRMSFLLKISGFVAFSDVSILLQKLQVLWSHTIQGSQVQKAVMEEYIGENGEAVTGIAYFVLRQNVTVDPTSVPTPSPAVLETFVFSTVPRYKSYTGAVFLYRDAFCYTDEGDVSVAKDNWNTKSESTSSVKLLQLQPAFGLYGMTLTRICYTASVNGKQLVPGRDPAPISNEVLAKDALVRKDALYSIVFYGAPVKEIIVKLVQNLDALWEKTLGSQSLVVVFGAEIQLTASPGITLITELFYGVMYNGSMLRPIDQPPPSVDDCLKNLSLHSFMGESVRLRSIIIRDPRPLSNFNDKVISAVKVAWNNIPGNTVKVKMPYISQEILTDEEFGPIVQVYYAVTQQNDSDIQSILEPTFKQLSDQLLAQGLQLCLCATWHSFRFYTKESPSAVSSRLNAIVTALHRAWSEANAGIEQSLIEIRFNQTGARKKRATNKDSDGSQLNVFSYHVAIQNEDPNPFFIQYPNESSILENLWNIAALQACVSCTLQKCGSVNIAGKLSADDNFLIEQALSEAFVNSNQPGIQATDITVSIKTITEVKDLSNAIASEVDYCVNWTTSMTISDLVIPSNDQISVALKNHGKQTIDLSTADPSAETLSYNVKIAIIVACCVGGFLLILVIGLVGFIIYRKRKLSINHPETDKQELATPDSDSFIGHGLYNPSPYNSLSTGPVQSKLKFRDSVGSDIST